jgi:hypothetical protein
VIKKLGFICAVALALTTSCSGKSDKLVPAAKKGEKAKISSEFEDPMIDILFVIDDSGSMDSHQRNLATNINLFVDEIRKFGFIDYRIGVTTSSVSDTLNSVAPRGMLYGNPKYVDRNTPQGDIILKSNLIVGTSGSGQEELLNPVYLALTPPMSTGHNAGFYRPDAYLAVVFITDAEDQSARTTPSMTPQFLYNFLVQLKLGDASKVLGYGAIIPSGVRNCSRDQMDEPRKIEEFFKLVNGQFFSLCDPTFGLQLGGVAKNLVKNVTKVVRLKRWPVVDTIRIVYGSQVVPNDYETGWVYEPASNSIVFGEKFALSNQPAGTELEITFVTARGE